MVHNDIEYGLVEFWPSREPKVSPDHGTAHGDELGRSPRSSPAKQAARPRPAVRGLEDDRIAERRGNDMIQSAELTLLPIFACLTEMQRERVAQNAADLHLQTGEWLIHEGEAPWFFVLLEGALDLQKEYGGSSQAITYYRPGDFFGETPILLDSLTIASLRAREPSRVLRIDRMQFKELMGFSPVCSDLIVREMTKRVTTIRQHMQDNNPLRVLVVGSQHDTECREIRTFLSLNRIPYEWVDRARDPERVPLCVPANASGPSVVVGQSICTGVPLTVRNVAEALGISTTPAQSDYDVVVIGGGPAGLAAAVYGASEGLRVLLVEKCAPGGQAGTSSRIENYLGFPDGISGDELSARALKQATRFGAEIVLTREVESIEPNPGRYSIRLDGGPTVQTKTVILATGVEWRRLEAEGIDRMLGKGVLYGAARTEARTVVGKDVFIVGGGNSAGQAAMFFSGYARSVTLLVRGADTGRAMSHYLIEQMSRRHNIFVQAHAKVVSVLGEDCLESIFIATDDEMPRPRKADALFVMIGARAKTDWLPEELHRDRCGFVYTGRDLPSWQHMRAPFLLETSLQGIFCAGDVRHASIKRVSSAVGEGSMAIAFIHQYLALEG
jgi:thioredoxin reductase (NADPH)